MMNQKLFCFVAGLIFSRGCACARAASRFLVARHCCGLDCASLGKLDRIPRFRILGLRGPETLKAPLAEKGWFQPPVDARLMTGLSCQAGGCSFPPNDQRQNHLISERFIARGCKP